TTAVYPPSLHDALPISSPSPAARSTGRRASRATAPAGAGCGGATAFPLIQQVYALRRIVSGAGLTIRPGPRRCLYAGDTWLVPRSEEHTSELQSLRHLV